MRTIRRLFTSLAVALAASCAFAAACSSTGGVPITLRLGFESLSDGRVTTPSGWQIVLDEATIVLGPVYAYAPIDEMALRRVLGPSIARAHGGFDPLSGRVVRAEYLDQLAFDALAEGVVEVGPIDGLLGAVDELTVVLDAPRGDNASQTGPTRGHQLWVRGTATRDEVTIAFEGGLDLEDDPLARRVDGISVSEGALDEGALLVVGVDPSRWLAEASFDEVVGTEDVVLIDEGTQAHRAWWLGARSVRAYDARVAQEM